MRLITCDYGMRLSNVCCVPCTVSWYSDNLVRASGNMVSLYVIGHWLRHSQYVFSTLGRPTDQGYMLLVISNLLSSCSYIHHSIA